MTANRDILRVVPTLHSISLLKHNLKKRKKRRVGALAFDNIVGTNLIRAESDFIALVD